MAMKNNSCSDTDNLQNSVERRTNMENNNTKITLANGKTMTLEEYVKPQQKEVRPLILGKVTSVAPLAQGRYYITPCWANPHGDDNICAFVSKNPKLPKEEVKLGLPVLFSVGKDYSNPDRSIALDVRAYVEGETLEFLVERPEDYPTNVSKSRNAQLKDSADLRTKVEHDYMEQEITLNPTEAAKIKLIHAVGATKKQYDEIKIDEDTPEKNEVAQKKKAENAYLAEQLGPQCSIFKK